MRECGAHTHSTLSESFDTRPVNQEKRPYDREVNGEGSKNMEFVCLLEVNVLFERTASLAHEEDRLIRRASSEPREWRHDPVSACPTLTKPLSRCIKASFLNSRFDTSHLGFKTRGKRSFVNGARIFYFLISVHL